MKWLEDKEDFVKQFIKLLNNYVSLYSKAVDYGSGEKISLSEVQVLERVIEHKEIRMSDLADDLGHTKAAITKSINKLEKKQLVKKFKKESNRKEKLIEVTKYGFDVYEKYQKYIYNNLFKDIFTLIDSVDDDFIENHQQLMDIVNDFYDKFKKKIYGE